MKKYVFMRILRSLVSIFLVTTLIYTIIYTMVPRKLIFKQDTNYNKIATTADKRDNYENTVFERMGYIEYYDTKELQEKASSIDPSVTVDANDTNKAIYEKDNYLLDTHTAVAYKVLLDNLDNEHASIVLSTASPYKFTESVYSSLFETQGEDEFTLMNKLHEQTKVVIPENDVNVQKSARNIKGVKTTIVDTMTVYDILNARNLVITENAIKKIEEVYA